MVIKVTVACLAFFFLYLYVSYLMTSCNLFFCFSHIYEFERVTTRFESKKKKNTIPTTTTIIANLNTTTITLINYVYSMYVISSTLKLAKVK